MKNILSKITPVFFTQIFLFLFANAVFVLKYTARIEAVNAVVVLIVYILAFLSFLVVYTAYIEKQAARFFQIAFWSILAITTCAIIGSLIFIDPYSVNVDRWSAVTFFLDGFFRGDYPYAVHTHVSENHFPSPFPAWYLVNLPFYFLGDVGVGLIFFLWLTALVVRYFFNSYKKASLFLFLLCISPAYWWELAVRSDSLSNVFLVFCFILCFSKKGYTLSNQFIMATLCCGFLAATRLSAILPVAIFFFQPYLRLSWTRKIVFPLAILAIVFFLFSPFIFWDTHTWVFFSRNPFMSQTSIGNSYTLVLSIVIGCLCAYFWKGMKQFFDAASIFIFLFILASQISLILTRGVDGSIFTDSLYDISYFSLALPYCFASLSEMINGCNKEKQS